jgi:hypothetical protein
MFASVPITVQEFDLCKGKSMEFTGRNQQEFSQVRLIATYKYLPSCFSIAKINSSRTMVVNMFKGSLKVLSIFTNMYLVPRTAINDPFFLAESPIVSCFF